jgi:hypothetical protein
MSLLFVLSLVLTRFLTFGKMEQQYLFLEVEYKDYWACYIEARQVT